MLERLLCNGARTIIVECPDRFARDLIVQLAGHDMLKAKGIALIAASAPTFFLEDTPTAVLVRQVLGAIAQFEKAGLVAKLAAARKRKRVATGKCEGRKSHAETNPQAVALAKALSRKRPKGGQLSLRSPRSSARGAARELARLVHGVDGIPLSEAIDAEGALVFAKARELGTRGDCVEAGRAADIAAG